MKITLYTITDCKFSAQEKDYLKANNLPFEEKNLETNKDFLTEMLNISNNFAGTPVTMIEKDGGAKVVLKGFTKEEFDKELNLGAPAAAPATTGEEAKAPEVAAAAPTEPAPVPPAPTAPTMPDVPPVPEAPAPTMPPTGTMPDMPPAGMPTAPEPSMPPAPTTPSIDETPVAPAPVMPTMPEPMVPPPAMPEPPAPAPMPPVAEPAPAVVPTGAPAPSAAPAPAANDDALNAILNNLQEKVNADAPKPPAA